MNSYNPLKQEAVLKAISDEYHQPRTIVKSASLTRGVFHKLCYLVDFEYYRRYERSMTGEIYVHTRNGPVPIHFNKVVNNLITDGRMSIGDGDTFNSPLTEFDGFSSSAKQRKLVMVDIPYDEGLREIAYHILPELRKDELDVIRKIVSEYRDMTAREMEPIVRQDPPWRLSSEGQEIDYELVFYRNNVAEEDE